MNVRLSLLACVAALALASCGGGSPSLPNAPHVKAQMANAHLVVTVPAGARSASSRRPQYTSPFTQSISVQVDTGTAVIQNLSPTSPNCTTAGANYPLNCTVPVSATVGTHLLTFVTYDQQNAAGNQLSANSISVTFTAGGNPAIPVTLDGVPAAIQVVPAPGASTIATHTTLTGAAPSMEFLWGTPASLIVTAADADGNLIVGPGAPALSVSVTGASVNSGIAVSPATNGDPNQFTLQSTGSGTATLSVTATPGSALAGSAISTTMPLRSTALTTTLINTGTTTPAFEFPSGITYDSANGDLYLMNSAYCQVQQIVPTANGSVTSIAGSACPYPPPYNYADGTGASAQFGDNLFDRMAYDSANGDLYLTDASNCSIRQVTTAGVVTTIAGGPPPTPSCGFADGTGSAALFGAGGPYGIAYDSKNGNLYVLDNCAIRQVTPAGVVTTIAGPPPPNASCGFTDGTGSAARLGASASITYDSAADALFVAEYSNCAIREVTAAGVVTTIAGAGPTGCGFADGTGSAAKFKYPSGIAYDSADGNLYVTETLNCAVRQVTPAGAVFTISGGATPQFCGGQTDGVGSFATLGAYVEGIAYDSATGYLYVADFSGVGGIYWTDAIRQIQL